MAKRALMVLGIGLAMGCTACGSDGGGTTTDSGTPPMGDGAIGDGAMTMPPMMVSNDVPLPPMRMSSSDLMREALAACERLIGAYEPMVVSQCTHSPTTQELVTELTDLHAEAVGTRPLPGRGLEAFAVTPAEVTHAGDGIDVISCTTNPTCMPGMPCSNMNAYALTNIAVTIDPLFTSFAEGAAFWGQLVEAAGGDPAAVDDVELYTGLGTIYAANAQGRHYQTVDEATVADLIENDEFVNEMFYGVATFLVLHEIGHADLGHSVVNHTARVGAQAVLAAEGRMLSAEETMQLSTELRALKVFTETQADIYSATLMRELGFSSDGPVVLFTNAMAAFLIASGACSAAMDQQQLYDCALQATPPVSHPPLDIRATVLRRIVDDGEDLSTVLEEITPPS